MFMFAVAGSGRRRDPAPGGERVVGVVVAVQGQADLLQVVDALGPPRRLACGLDGGQEQGDQDADDRDDHQELDQREGRAASAGGRCGRATARVLSGAMELRPADRHRRRQCAPRTCPPDALGRSIAWVTRRAVFWLASRAVPGRLPTGFRPQWHDLSGDLLAYSGGPAPESHRLPAQPFGQTPDGHGADSTSFPRRDPARFGFASPDGRSTDPSSLIRRANSSARNAATASQQVGGRLEVDGHRRGRSSGVSTRAVAPVDSGFSGICALGPVGQGRLDLGAEQVVGQRLGRLGVGRPLEHGQGVGDEQRAELVRLAVGIDDRDRAAGVDLPIASSVSVRPKAIWPEPTACATCLLPERTWTPFAFRSRKNALAFSSPQAANRQAACVAVVPNSGLAMPILPFHLGSSRSRDPRRPVGLGHELACSPAGSAPAPRSRTRCRPWSRNVAGHVAGVRRAGTAASRPLLLEPDRVEDLVVPEQVAPRPARPRRRSACRQADRLGALDVELRPHLQARPVLSP